MAIGADGRVGIAKEVTYGTRVAPARFLPLTGETLTFQTNRYVSPAIGMGMWARPSVVVSRGPGAGELRGDVPSIGLGYILDGLVGGTVTPVQQGATTAYLATFPFTAPPTKSFSVQAQTPPVTSSVLVPHDMLGTMFTGITISWDPGGVASFSIPAIFQDLSIVQSLATYVAPTAYNLLPFSGGRLTVGGVEDANIIGGGSVTITWPMRDDARPLGSDGLIKKPILSDKPTAAGTFTADFEDNTNLSRMLNDTSGDVVLEFEGATIASTYTELLRVTIPDCKFTSSRPTIDGPGLVQETVSFEAASAAGDAPSIEYRTTGATL